MKVRFALLAGMAILAAPLAAQGGNAGMRMGGGMTGAAPSIDSLRAQLALTAEQAPKVEAALAAYTASTKESQEFMAKMRESGNMQGMRDNPDAMKHMTTLREARTKLATDIKAVLTAEQLVPHRKRNGFTAYEWEQIPGRENHYLDTRVYARAAAAVAGLDRFFEADWCELERDAGQEQLALPLADASADAGAAGSAPASSGDSPSAPAAGSAWLRRRRRWLR